MKNHSVYSMDTIRYSNYRGVDKLLALWQYKGIQANFKTCKSFKPKTPHHNPMLLTQLIDQQHNLYADIQAKIEVLQEEQRRIQAFIQQLGSVDSQMVAALQLLEEAIASIRLVCPDQLSEYKQSVGNLFANRLSLNPHSEPETETKTVEVETESSPEPESSPETETVEVETESSPEIITTMFYGWKGTSSHDHVSWRIRDNVMVTQVIKQLRITPKDITVDESNIFGDHEHCYNADITHKAFDKLIEYGDITVKVDKP